MAAALLFCHPRCDLPIHQAGFHDVFSLWPRTELGTFSSTTYVDTGLWCWQVRPLGEPDPHQVWGYFGSGFVAATLKLATLDLEFYGIVDGVSKPVYSLTIPKQR